MTWETYTLDVCADCLLFIANGDIPEDSDGWNPEAIDLEWPPAGGWQLHAGAGSDDCHACAAGECEGWFSWSSCDACGSRLGGDRYHATAMRQVNE